MAVNATQFVNTIGGFLRKGQSEAASGIYNDWILTLLPTALDTLTEKVAKDPERRGLLTRKFVVPLFADGTGNFNPADSKAIQKASLCYAQCEDLGKQDGMNENVRLIYKPNWQDVAELNRYLDPQFAYFSVRNNTVVTRASGGDPAVLGPLWIYAVYVPDFDTYEMPDELAGEGVAHVIALAASVLSK